TEIAKALHIHPDYPTKYFGLELGSQSKYDPKTEKTVVNGQHQANDLAKLLDRFIQQYILCPTCHLPELKMSIKASYVKIACDACGHSSHLKGEDHLVKYMIKHPSKTSNASK